MSESPKTFQELIQRIQSILIDGGCSGNITINEVGDYFILNLGYSIPKKRISFAASSLPQPVSAVGNDK